jgi:flagellar biosynthesis protein FliQ
MATRNDWLVMWPLTPEGQRILGADRALSLLDQMLWNALVVAAPILLATLIVGVLISIVQTATQIQEMTLSYVPKILVAALLLISIGGWMIGRITDMARQLYLLIPTFG